MIYAARDGIVQVTLVLPRAKGRPDAALATNGQPIWGDFFVDFLVTDDGIAFDGTVFAPKGKTLVTGTLPNECRVHLIVDLLR